MFSFTSRLSKENKRKEEIYLSRTVLLLTFTFSLISELSLGFAAMPVCYGVIVFFFVLTGFVFNVIFFLHFVHYHSNMQACTFFKKKDKSFIQPSIHSSSNHYTTYLNFYLICLQDMSKMRLWQGMQI